jgi:cell division protein FtsQ
VTVAKNRQSGMRAEKRSFNKSSQPLKPVNRTASRVVLGTILFVVLAVTAVNQYGSVVGFINRPISKVRIENQWQQVSESEVGIALSEFMGTGFLNFNVRGAKQKLEQMPWVEFVSVKRIWPDTLSLELQEEVAIARWGKASYLNQTGQVISPMTAAVDRSLPTLRGPDGSQIEVMLQYQKLNQLLSPEGLRLTELDYSKRGSWELTLNNTVRVSAGRQDVFENIARLVTFVTTKPGIDLADIASVDLRYNNGFAVKTIERELSGVAVR